MRILDRYIIREILLPFAIALVVLSFVLIIPFIIELAEQLIEKGVAGPIILQLMVTLLPATLGLTIPMALLIAVLVAFGRLSGDREIVVLMACGVSPYRLLRPVFGAGRGRRGGDTLGDDRGNPQRESDTPRNHRADRRRSGRRSGAAARVLRRLPQHRALCPRSAAEPAAGRTSLPPTRKNAAQPILYVAKSGRMVVNREARTIQMVLEDGAQHTTKSADPAAYEIVRFKQLVVWPRPRERVSARRAGARRTRDDHPRAAGAIARARRAQPAVSQPGDRDPQEVLDSRRLPGVCAARRRARRQQPERRQAGELRPRHRGDLRLLRDHVTVARR